MRTRIASTVGYAPHAYSDEFDSKVSSLPGGGRAVAIMADVHCFTFWPVLSFFTPGENLQDAPMALLWLYSQNGFW